MTDQEKQGWVLPQEEGDARAATPAEPAKDLKTKFIGLFTKENFKKLGKRWFIDAFTGMALGLFATLIAGTIIEQIGKLVGSVFIQEAGKIAKSLMGAGIGAGIAYMLKADKLTIFSCIVAGLIGARGNGAEFSAFGSLGNPIGAYLGALIACEVCLLYAGKTPIDIVLIPLGAILVAALVAYTLCAPVNWLVAMIAKGITVATAWSPFIMGVVIAVVMGILLTLPTSSAAIWVMIAAAYPNDYYMLLAGGAAAVGCAAHMVGFAVASFRENKWGGLIAQGLGTSMLQIPNLMKNPRILIPPIVASAVVGPLSTTVFKLLCTYTGGGMGTSGLVGVLGTIEASQGNVSTAMLVIGILLLFFVLPAVISLAVSELLRKVGWIKFGDMKLNI